MSTLRILVTGSRDHRDKALIRDTLLGVLAEYTTIGAPVLVHGGQVSYDKATGERYGADYLAGEAWTEIARERPGWLAKPEVYPAAWSECGPECSAENPEKCRRTRRGGIETYCSRAGNHRNQKMVDLGATVVLAFPTATSRGTWDCVTRAQKAGLTTMVIPERSEVSS